MARQSREPILLTRPDARADRFAGQLRQRFGAGLRIVLSPQMQSEFLSPALPRDLRGVIFTAETGVEGFRRLWDGPTLPAWCVGDRTARAATTAGFPARSAAGTAEDLVAAILADAPPGPLLHARGREATGDVAARLTARGIPVAEAVVYAQNEAPLTPAARDLLAGAGPVVVPLFSPRAARLFAKAGPFAAPLWIAALSPAVAEAAAAAGPERLAVAAEPQAGAMVDAIARLFDAAAQP